MQKMDKFNCPNFENCSAAICPLDPTNLDDAIYYPDEEICKRRDFQRADWIRKQKAVVKVGAAADRYWTVDMLRAAKQVRKGIEGINPDQPLDEARKAEQRWIVEKKGGRVIAKQNQKSPQVVAKKRNSLAFVTNTSHQGKEVKNRI